MCVYMKLFGKDVLETSSCGPVGGGEGRDSMGGAGGVGERLCIYDFGTM